MKLSRHSARLISMLMNPAQVMTPSDVRHPTADEPVVNIYTMLAEDYEETSGAISLIIC